MGRPAEAKAWRIISRPVLESVLNNHAQHHWVPRPILLFHGPCGIGKTFLLHRLLPAWNTSPHLAAYVNFASDDGVSAVASDYSIAIATTATPWGAFACLSPPPVLDTLHARLEHALESLVDHGVRLGTIGSRDVFTVLNKWHGLHTALHRIIGRGPRLSAGRHESVATLWAKAVLAFTVRVGPGELDAAKASQRRYSMEEVAYVREARVALRLAKEVIGMHQEWRREECAISTASAVSPGLLPTLPSIGRASSSRSSPRLYRSTSFRYVVRPKEIRPKNCPSISLHAL